MLWFEMDVNNAFHWLHQLLYLYVFQFHIIFLFIIIKQHKKKTKNKNTEGKELTKSKSVTKREKEKQKQKLCNRKKKLCSDRCQMCFILYCVRKCTSITLTQTYLCVIDQNLIFVYHHGLILSQPFHK